MTQALAKFGKAGLPSVEKQKSAFRKMSDEVGLPTGVHILKMDKSGAWVFGPDSDAVEDGTLWAVNPFSFVWGYIAWGEGEVLEEHMASITEDKPSVGPAPDGAKKGWELQLGCMLMCVDSPIPDDIGTKVRYSVTSYGGKKFIQDLANTIDNILGDEDECVPIIELFSESYKSKKYGKIFNPLFKVVRWCDLAGLESEDSEPEPEPEPEKTRSRKADEPRSRKADEPRSRKAAEPEPEQDEAPFDADEEERPAERQRPRRSRK